MTFLENNSKFSMFLLSGNLLAQFSKLFLIEARIVFISSNYSFFLNIVSKEVFNDYYKFSSRSDNTKLPPKAKSKAFLYKAPNHNKNRDATFLFHTGLDPYYVFCSV
jgi:hypothetical protein